MPSGRVNRLSKQFPAGRSILYSLVRHATWLCSCGIDRAPGQIFDSPRPLLCRWPRVYRLFGLPGSTGSHCSNRSFQVDTAIPTWTHTTSRFETDAQQLARFSIFGNYHRDRPDRVTTCSDRRRARKILSWPGRLPSVRRKVQPP